MRPLAVLMPLAALAGATACAAPDTEPPPRAGGATTIDDRTTEAFGFPAPNLDDADLARHLDGDVRFEASFVTPPAEVNPGLGPLYNHTACVRCHVRDGRGLPVAGPGPLGTQLVVRVSVHGEAPVTGAPLPAPGLGTQLQDRAVYGATPEATVAIDWVEVTGAYGDGEPYMLRRPRLTITLPDGRALPGDVLVSPRIPPPVFGLGLLEAIPAEDVAALADSDDLDGDGVSGRVNLVRDAGGEATLGRFGWKATEPELTALAAGAYAADLGVTPDELAPGIVEDTAFYTRTLAVPARAVTDDPDVARGEALFDELGCAACHVAAWRTGDHAVAALRDQTIHPYTDLLLHNVGFDLADGRPEHLASGTEWRTPPLWGLGLTQTVLPGAGLLHDGRARTIAEAILWHGGEAERAKEAFRLLPASDRRAVLAFLGSL